MLLLAIDAHYVQCGLVYSAVGIENRFHSTFMDSSLISMAPDAKIE